MKTPSFYDRIIRPCLLTAALLTAGLPTATFARDAVLSKTPIPLRVGVGKEAIISFPQPATHTRILNEASANGKQHAHPAGGDVPHRHPTLRADADDRRAG